MKRSSRKSWRLAAVLTVAVIGVGTWGVMQVIASSTTVANAMVLNTNGGKVSPYAPPVGNPYWSTHLLKTYVNRGTSSATIPAYPGLLALDAPTSITCAPPNTFNGSCGLVADDAFQAGVASTATTVVGEFVYVDGLPISAGPILGLVPQTTFQAYHFQDTAVGLTPGTHTVQTFVSGAGGTSVAGNFSVEYRVFGNP